MPTTKIVATIGPASSNYTMMRKMVSAGLDIVRLNLSHGRHQQHLEVIEMVRGINKKNQTLKDQKKPFDYTEAPFLSALQSWKKMEQIDGKWVVVNG